MQRVHHRFAVHAADPEREGEDQHDREERPCENFHVIDPFPIPNLWQDAISIDPGLNNPLAAHWYAVDYDGNVYVVAEHFEAGKDVSYHSEKIKEISDRLGWHRAANGNIEAYIDSAANQRTLSYNKSVTELFFEHGINCNPKVNKDLFSGIARVKEYLKNMKEADKFFNYISNKNNAKISFYTSQSNICYCSNILSDNVKVSQFY